MSCGWLIVFDGVKKFMWVMLAGLILITAILVQFLLPRDFTRLLIVGSLWIVLILVLDIVVSLMIVNWVHLSKPADTVEHEHIK